MVKFLTTVFFFFGSMAALSADLTGEWSISAKLGEAAINVSCNLIQDDNILSGTCTPELENPQASSLSGSVSDTSAEWGYDVVFNGNEGKVEFSADTISDTSMSGTLSLSGTPVTFNAAKQITE